MNIIQPKGFITDTAPLIEWTAVDGVTYYQLSITDNVNGSSVINATVSSTSYQIATALPLGTYAIQVVGGDSIAIEVVIITDTIAEYNIVGRDGDVNYTAYKAYQMAIRQQAKQLGGIANSILATDEAIAELLTATGDAALGQFHVDTVNQTPGFTQDFVQVLALCQQASDLIKIITKRDPQF